MQTVRFLWTVFYVSDKDKYNPKEKEPEEKENKYGKEIIYI